LMQERIAAAKASLKPQLAKFSQLRKISLNRLEEAISGRQNVPTDEMRCLAGLLRVQYVFYYPDSDDIVVAGPAEGTPSVVPVEGDGKGKTELLGYEIAENGGVDLSKAEVIVSAGRGVGKPENIAMVAGLAKALGGEYGASRPVVDSLWVEHNRQVGTTGMTVSPKLYVACGISGAVQHLAGMKKSDFIVAINTDKDAPIGDVADVFAVADLKQLLPVLTEKLQAL